MKIFVFFPEYDTYMYRWVRLHIFDELSRHGIQMDSFNPLSCNSWEEANEKAIDLLKNNHYDLFFTPVCHERALFIETIENIKKKGIPTLCMRSDNLVMPFYDKTMAPHFDLVWLTAKETRRFYDKWNAKTVFAPYAASPYLFPFIEQSLIRRVCFIGTPYGSRTRMMNALTRGGVDLELFYGAPRQNEVRKQQGFNNIISVPQDGFGSVLINRLRFREGRKLIMGTAINKLSGSRKILTNQHLFQSPSVDLNKISNIYSSYSLALSSTSAVHTDVLKNPLKIINLRNFEIPMSGGLEICRYNEELAGYYEENKEILFYNTYDELIDKAKYYTLRAKDSEVLMMKRAARERSVNEHTWYNRFKTVLGALDIVI